MSPLEERYRRLLRLLPAGYRAAWADDMVATYLESATTGDPEEDELNLEVGRPGRAEVASVVALAVRLRLGGVDAPAGAFVWGSAVRLVALIGLLVNAVLATVNAVILLWLTGGLRWLPAPPADRPAGGAADRGWLAFELACVVLLPAYVALVHGHRHTAAIVAGTVFLAGLAATVLRLATDGGPVGDLALWTGLLFNGLLVAALAAFHREAPAVPHRPWLIAIPVALAIGAGVVLLMLPGLVLLDWQGMWCVAVTVAVAVHLAGPAFGRTRPLSWSLALSLLAGGALLIRAASLAHYVLTGSAGATGGLVPLGVVEGLALLAVGVPLVVLTARALRRTRIAESRSEELATHP